MLSMGATLSMSVMLSMGAMLSMSAMLPYAATKIQEDCRDHCVRYVLQKALLGVGGGSADSRSMIVASVFRQRPSRSTSAWSSLTKSANLHSSASRISL